MTGAGQKIYNLHSPIRGGLIQQPSPLLLKPNKVGKFTR